LPSRTEQPSRTGGLGKHAVDLLKYPAVEPRGYFHVSGSHLFSLCPLDPAPGERGLRGHSTFTGYVFGAGGHDAMKIVQGGVNCKCVLGSVFQAGIQPEFAAQKAKLLEIRMELL